MKSYTTHLHRFTYTILLVFVFHFLAHTQSGGQNLGGAAVQGIGGAGVCLDNISSLYTNQAGSAFIKNWSADVSVDRRFDLEELTTISVALAKNVGFGTVGLNVSQYGFDAYAEQKIGLSYARLLTDYFALSGQVDMLGFKIDGFGNTYKYTVEFGIYSRLSDKVHLAAHIFNPTSIQLTDNEEIDSRISIGAKYIPSNKVKLYSEFEKIIDRDVQFKLGVTYKVIDDLDINIGSNLTTQAFNFGFQYKIKDAFTIAASFGFNNNIQGTSPAFSGQYVSTPSVDK